MPRLLEFLCSLYLLFLFLIALALMFMGVYGVIWNSLQMMFWEQGTFRGLVAGVLTWLAGLMIWLMAVFLRSKD